MGTLLWRVAPILTLTVRQFVGGRLLRVALVLSLLPCIFAGIYLLNPDIDTPAQYLADLFRELVVPTLLPITVLLLATAALGNEVEDRTLPYLTMKPVTRLRIVLGKLLGVLVVALPTVLLGLALTVVIVAQARGVAAQLEAQPLLPLALAMLAAAAAGTLLIASVFLAVSLIVPRALLAGIIYVFAWESLLGRFLPGIQTISLRHYTLSVFDGLTDAAEATLPSAVTLGPALTTIGVVVVIAIIVATLRLRTMNLD